MLAASRTSAARSIARSARRFATVVDSAGVKVAAADHGEPTAAVTLLVKAGSRYEPKQGVAHALKHYAFKSTDKRSSLGTVREAELYGGLLSSSLSREHLAVTAEFLRGDEAFFVDVLTSFLTSSKFTRYELQEAVAPAIDADRTAAFSDPATHAIELAHALAFRSGLGNALFATDSHAVSAEDVQAFARGAFAQGSVAVLGTGIDPAVLERLVAQALQGRALPPASASASASAPAPTAAYFGGETRVGGHAHGAQTVFIGFGTASAATPALAVLAAHLDPTPSVKWAQGTAPLAGALAGVGASVRPVLLPYSDAALFGLLVQGESADAVRVAGKMAVEAVKGAGALSGEGLKRAVAKARFEAAVGLEKRDGVVAALGAKILAGSGASAAEVVGAFEKVDAAAYAKAAAALLKSKPTYVAVGDIAALPYADELGL